MFINSTCFEMHSHNGDSLFLSSRIHLHLGIISRTSERYQRRSRHLLRMGLFGFIIEKKNKACSLQPVYARCIDFIVKNLLLICKSFVRIDGVGFLVTKS